MYRDVVFTKTEAGKAAILERSKILSTKQRQLLIMMDGQKRVGDLFPNFDETAQARVSGLFKNGLITTDQTTESHAEPEPQKPSAPLAISPLLVSRRPSAVALANLRRILSMCSQQYLDDALDLLLVDVFDQLKSTSDLQFCLDQWLKHMRASQPESVTTLYLTQIKNLL